ncbi:MAG: hypothetical protein KC912_04335 [Proteobacteria bacterium]|nr:hypothetical protein [Pseudomonadota bacterium]
MRWLPLLLLGCAGDDTLSFEADIAPIVQQQCSGCHAGAEAEGGLDLSASPYDVLQNQESNQSDLALIEPGDALYSYLWHKVNGTQALAEGSGTSMPLGWWLAPEEIDRIGDWIDEGAAY